MDSPKMDINKFLNSIKIKNVENIRVELQKRDVDINELIEFSPQDLDAFLKTDLGLDTLSRNRFKKELNKLRPKPISKQLNISTQMPQRKIIISNQEQQALQSLYERYDVTSKLQNTIMEKLPNLDNEMTACIDSINKQFEDILITLVQNRKQQLLENIDALNQKKLSQLNEQSEMLKVYQNELNNAKQKREQMVNTNDRKASDIRLNILNKAIHSNNGFKYFITAPKIKFNNQLNDKYISLFCNSLELDTFDVPFKPYIIIYRLGFKWCGIVFYVKNEIKSKDEDVFYVKYEISYCSAPDKDQLDDITVSDKTNFDMFDKEIEILQNEYGYDDTIHSKKDVKKQRNKQKHKRKKRPKKKRDVKKKKKKVNVYTNYDGESDNSDESELSKQSTSDGTSDSDDSDDTDSDEEEKYERKKKKVKRKTIKLKKVNDIFCVQMTDYAQFKWKKIFIKA
eukprot:29752_1